MNVKNMALMFMGFLVRAAILAIVVLVIFRTGQKAYDFGFRIFTEGPVAEAPGRDISAIPSTMQNTDSSQKFLKMFFTVCMVSSPLLIDLVSRCFSFSVLLL